jgi:hypothetical protein
MNLIHENLEPVEFKDYDHAKEDRALKDQESHNDDWDDKPQNAATKKTTKTELTPAAATAKIVIPDTTPDTPADDSGDDSSNPGAGSSTSGGTDGGGTEGGGTEGGGTEG